ncbi:MAG: hypothetical protein HQK54_11070 [Oligoflexales bacterium]|nr:hypothetical protein [Oligoflexales bacterium]
MKKSILFALLLPFAAGCRGEGSSSKSSSQDTPDSAAPLSATDAGRIPEIAMLISSFIGNIENRSVAGKNTGNINISATDCPEGGTVAISGKTRYEEKTNQKELNYVMAGCASVQRGYTITLTGTVAESGSVQAVSGVILTENLTYKAGSQVAVVIKNAAGEIYFDNSCTFSILVEQASRDSAISVSGTLCGYSASKK